MKSHCHLSSPRCVCLAFSLAVALLSQSPPSGGETPTQLRARSEDADATLNAVYKDIIARCTDEQFKAMVRGAERAWIKYRDSFADYRASAATDESSRRLAREETVMTLTKRQALRLSRADENLKRGFARSVETKEQSLVHLAPFGFQIFMGDEGMPDPQLLTRLDSARIDFTKKFVHIQTCLDYGVLYALSDLTSEFRKEWPLSLLSPVDRKDYRIDEQKNTDNNGGFISEHSDYSLVIKGVNAPIKIAEKEKRTFNGSNRSEEDGFVSCLLKWVIPGRLLLVSVETSYSGTGGIHEATDSFFLIQNGTAQELLEQTCTLHYRCGAPFTMLEEREYRWNNEKQTLIIGKSRTTASECEEDDFQVEDSEESEMTIGSGRFQKLKRFEKQRFTFTGDTIQPSGVNEYAVFLGDDAKSPSDLANYLALYKKATMESVRGTAPAEEVQQLLTELKKMNPKLVTEKKWKGVIYLAQPLRTKKEVSY